MSMCLQSCRNQSKYMCVYIYKNIHAHTHTLRSCKDLKRTKILSWTKNSKTTKNETAELWMRTFGLMRYGQLMRSRSIKAGLWRISIVIIDVNYY